MVRKLKRHKEDLQENLMKLVKEIEDFEDDEIEESEEKSYSKFEPFEIDIPLKSDLLEPMNSGQGNKIEKLTERFDIRITTLEKEILKNLKENGINVSEEIRKMILKLNESLVSSKIKDKYIKCANELENNLILIENLKINYLEIKYLRGKTQEEAQELVNRRYKIKYELDSLIRASKHLINFLNKYTGVLPED